MRTETLYEFSAGGSGHIEVRVPIIIEKTQYMAKLALVDRTHIYASLYETHFYDEWLDRKPHQVVRLGVKEYKPSCHFEYIVEDWFIGENPRLTVYNSSRMEAAPPTHAEKIHLAMLAAVKEFASTESGAGSFV